MLVAVAAMAFVGCNNDLISVDTLKKPTVITFNASMEDDTRTSMTDENSDGKYEVNWSAGDKVAFVVYSDNDSIDNDSIIEIQTATVAEDGASAELTVEFKSELTTGQRIVAYCNYSYYASESWNSVEEPWLSQQTPQLNDAQKHYISAEYTYNGEAVAPLKFSHDYAYAKMVVEGLESVDNISITLNETENINLYCDNVTNNIFMFTYHAMEVNTITVEATIYDENYISTTYSFSKELEKPLNFNKGRIAKFTIKDWKSILEAPTNVQATEVTKDSITFSWNAVEGAKDYTYTITTGNSWDPTIVVTDTTAETSVVVSGLEPLTEYSISVVANPVNSETHATSKEGYAYATTGADRSVLDKEFTEVVEFANMTKLENYTNTYLFTTDGGGTTIDDKFMYLKFNSDIDFSKSGEYSIDDLSSSNSECCIWVGRAVDGCRGYINYYNLAFTPYHFYPNSGDTYVIYVDVVDGKSSITVYANNASYWSAIKFKGVYVEKSMLATPVVTATAERNTITATWEAIEGAANYTVTCGNESKTIEGTTATFEGLEYATEYTVSVVANPTDTTNYKASLAGEATATTITLTTLATPSNLNYTIEGNIVTITWDAVENAKEYYVYDDSNTFTATTTETSAPFTLNEYGYYYFNVVAKAEVGSLYKDSYEAYVNVPYEDPRQILPAPTNVTATVDGASATISWDRVEGADGYQVLYYLNGYENRVDVKETTITLEVGYSVQNLYIYVFAIAKEDNTQYLSSTSWEASVVVNTEGDPSVAVEGFTPVRAELDLYSALYEYNGGDAEYAFWLYDAEDACLEVIYKFGPHTDWDDVFVVNMTKADGTVVEGYTSLQTQQPNDYNCAAGEKYYVVVATLSDGTEINIQAQLPTTEVNYLGEGATTPGEGGDEPGTGDEVIVLNSADIYNPSGFGDFYVNLYGAELEFVLNFYNCAGAEENFIKAGTYQVSTGNGVVYPGSYSRIWFGEGDDDYYVIDSGSVTVSEVDGQYKFDINVGTSNGLTFVATYTGAVEGLVVPSAYVEPEVGEPQELIIQKHSTSYTGTNEHEIQFWYDYDNYLMVTIDFEANPITAGTYTLEDGLIGQYCNSHNQKMKECTVVVTDNGDGTLTFDASFVVGYDAYYFTYTAQIYS